MSRLAFPLIATAALISAANGHAQSPRQIPTTFKIVEASVAQIHAAYKAGTLTARALTQQYLDRIEAYDRRGPMLNSIITVNPNALEDAGRLDAQFKKSGPVGPMHGIPILVKDEIDTAGMPTTLGAGGGVGMHMIEMAALFGGQVAGLEASEHKLDVIRRLGAVPVLSRTFDDIDLRPVWAGEAPTVVIDLVGSRASLTWALASLPLGGRLVVLTTFRDVDIPVSPRDLVLREITVYGSRYASKAELREAAALVAAGKIHPVVSQVVPAADVEDVHRALREGTLIGRGALDWTM